MVEYFKKRKREREILHNYLEFLTKIYDEMEPIEMTNSICKLYDRLNYEKKYFMPFALLFLVGLLGNNKLKKRLLPQKRSNPIQMDSKAIGRLVQKAIHDKDVKAQQKM